MLFLPPAARCWATGALFAVLNFVPNVARNLILFSVWILLTASSPRPGDDGQRADQVAQRAAGGRDARGDHPRHGRVQERAWNEGPYEGS